MKKISLTNSKLLVLLDDSDYERCSQRNWYLTDGGYVRSSSRIRLSRFLMGEPPEGREWDHENGNKLDNQRQNLRSATKSQNKANTGRTKANHSGFKGVHWYRKTRRWRASIQKDGQVIHLGYFSDRILAAKAYDVAAKKLYREFARPNFPMRFPREASDNRADQHSQPS